MAVNIGMKYFENILVNEEYLVYFQQQKCEGMVHTCEGFYSKRKFNMGSWLGRYNANSKM